MSNDVPENQLLPMQSDPDEMEQHYDDDEDHEDLFDEPTASMDDADDQISAEDGAQAILPQGDPAFARDVLGVEGFEEMNLDQEEQDELQESVEDDLEPKPEPEPLEHADADLEPEQQAQRTSHKPFDDETLGDGANAPDHAATNMAVTISRPSEHNAEVDDSSSLFFPERWSSSHSPAPVPLPPRLNAVPPRQTSTPVNSASSKLSVFGRVREMQKIAQEKKAALSRARPTQMPENVDPETYLQSVTASIRAPAGAYPQPAVDEGEMEHRVALADFQRQKNHYEELRRQNNGRLGFRHDVEWMRIQGAEHARIKKRQRELAEIHPGDEQDLFPQVPDHPNEQDDESDDNFYGEGPSRKRRRGEQPRKQSKPVDFQEAELQAMRVALEADEDANPKKKTKGSANNSDSQHLQSTPRSRGSKSRSSRAPRSKAAGKSAAKGSRKNVKDRRELENATRQATSLFNANVFEQQAGVGAAEQPQWREKTKNKADALKELIASVPVADKKQSRNDMNTLLSASRDFDGRGACKVAPGGNWLVRGMTTSLKGYQVLGTAFMRRRENDDKEPRGGLMADQMGLGKTLMMLGELPHTQDSWGASANQYQRTS